MDGETAHTVYLDGTKQGFKFNPEDSLEHYCNSILKRQINYMWLNQAKLNARQCWPAVSPRVLVWGGWELCAGAAHGLQLGFGWQAICVSLNGLHCEFIAHRVVMDTLRVQLGFICGLTLLSRHHSPSLSIVDEFNEINYWRRLTWMSSGTPMLSVQVHSF